MDSILKKNTKHLINLRTNNYIQQQIHKQEFFNDLIQALQTEFKDEPQNYQFLMDYLLAQPTTNFTMVNGKKIKIDTKIHTQKRIPLQILVQKPFNINDIDPSLFQTEKRQNYLNRRQLLNKKIINRQNQSLRANTPRQRSHKIIFQNKKLLDLDRKIEKSYECLKKKIYQPDSLFYGKQNQPKIKTSLKGNCFKVQKINRKKQAKMYGFNTEFMTNENYFQEDYFRNSKDIDSERIKDKNLKQQDKKFKKDTEVPNLFIDKFLNDKYKYEKDLKDNRILKNQKLKLQSINKLKVSNNYRNIQIPTLFEKTYVLDLNKKLANFTSNRIKTSANDFSDRNIKTRYSTMR